LAFLESERAMILATIRAPAHNSEGLCFRFDVENILMEEIRIKVVLESKAKKTFTS
jgi:hypothetical protein